MCTGSKMADEGTFSMLLELAASDNLIGFKHAVEEEGHDMNEVGLWYGKRIGSNTMGFEYRTPLAIAALFGSKNVLAYVIGTSLVDVNKACGTDRATALHCAAAGGSINATEVVKMLLDASADVSSLDLNGNRPGDIIAPVVNSFFITRKKNLEIMLKGSSSGSEEEVFDFSDQIFNNIEILEQQDMPILRNEKREYPIDLTLPDIKTGIYGTDEFRMYNFKVKPCSRAYSHDWTECPFVHPGENARRRDPKKYHYSCVPCPEFRKGACRQGDTCEYAHGIFECWLHPAQYRTRMCKDETNCTRRVCFFAHKHEELRPLYASTGSAVPSPRSFSNVSSSLDMGPISPLALGSPPLTPSGSSSPIGGNMWSNVNLPALQLPGSRLKSALSARDVDFELELLGLENRRRWQQQMMDEMSGLSPSADRTGDLNRFGGIIPTNLEDIYGAFDPTILPQLKGLAMDGGPQQLRSSYSTSLSTSPRMSPVSSYGIDPSVTSAAAALSSRSAAFAKRSQSFIERSAVNRHNGFSSPTSSPKLGQVTFSDWGSPGGKLDWGIQGEELNKLRKSASFGIRASSDSGGRATNTSTKPAAAMCNEPDVSWVQSLVKDTSTSTSTSTNPSVNPQPQCHIHDGGMEICPVWAEQVYIEQEQMVA